MDKTRRLLIAVLIGLIAGLIFSFVMRNTKEPEAMIFAPRVEAVEEPATLNVPIMRFTDEEADELQENWANYPDVKALYVSKNVLFTTEQCDLFANTDIYIIPDYYFNFELKEVGESW